MIPDFSKAATKAAECLIKHCIRVSPVSPLRILEQLENVIVISFADLSDLHGVSTNDIIPLFGKNRDAVSSIHTEQGRQIYVVAYNSLLPFAMVQRGLARELGHILLQHEESSPENSAEAACFVHHLLCPRPLIHAIQATGIRVTVDLIANLTGTFDQDLIAMRRLPEAIVPAGTNRFLRGQFMPFIINFFEFYQTVMPNDGSAIADFGSYMDGYIE